MDKIQQFLQSPYAWWVPGILLGAPLILGIFLPQSRLRRVAINSVLWLCGGLSLLLGIIGIFLPLLPTVPFILLTAACWGRASPRFHAWLHRHPYFGPMVRNWEQRRAIPRRAKYLAWTMMTVSCLMLFYRLPQYWWVGVAVSCVCLAVGLWMAKRPDA
ncbi:DUF454 domain-containing protein [Conchiformibius steedae]|uniref:DUF454 domain-containing protein n=1 Tax=Conchiformibius steedae TaxID=153493 RepID=A0A3P2A642_9NEIS|nr:DUF454 domain-containing protein [Conchiformibius steedae]